MLLRRLVPLTALLGLIGCAAGVGVTPSGGPAVAAGRTVAVADGQKPLWISAAGGWLYCDTPNSGQVSLLDTATAHTVVSLPLSAGSASYVRNFLDRRQVLVSDPVAGQLWEVDADAASLSPAPHKLQALATGTGEARIAMMEDNNTVAATASGTDQAYIFTFAEDRTKVPVRTTFTVGAPATDGRPRPIDIRGNQVLVPDYARHVVETIQLGTGAFTTRATVQDPGPLGFGTIAVGASTAPDGGLVGHGTVDAKVATAVITDRATNQVLIVDLATNQVTTLSDVGRGPSDMVIDADSQRAFITMSDSNELTIIDYAAKTVVAKLAVGKAPDFLALAPPTPGELWVANADNTISVVDGHANPPVVKRNVAVGTGPHRLTFWGTNGFVSNQGDGTVSIVDRITLR